MFSELEICYLPPSLDCSLIASAQIGSTIPDKSSWTRKTERGEYFPLSAIGKHEGIMGSCFNWLEACSPFRSLSSYGRLLTHGYPTLLPNAPMPFRSGCCALSSSEIMPTWTLICLRGVQLYALPLRTCTFNSCFSIVLCNIQSCYDVYQYVGNYHV